MTKSKMLHFKIIQAVRGIIKILLKLQQSHSRITIRQNQITLEITFFINEML